MTTPPAKPKGEQAPLPTVITANDEFDRFLITETLTQPGEEPSPIATFLHQVAAASPADPKSALVFALQLLEQAFDAGRVVGQMDIFVEVVQDETFGREVRNVVRH